MINDAPTQIPEIAGIKRETYVLIHEAFVGNSMQYHPPNKVRQRREVLLRKEVFSFVQRSQSYPDTVNCHLKYRVLQQYCWANLSAGLTTTKVTPRYVLESQGMSHI